jgi:tRNA pseudouridine55 synthase
MSYNGILVIDKPAGYTSHDVVAKMRRATRERRIGHTGTLDPAATGVLVLCMGPATRLIPFLDESDKRYLAHLILGIVTDTQDHTGEILASHPETAVTRAALSEVLSTFTGPIQQVPPMYSAIKKNGRPLYELARQGKTVEREARTVLISALTPAQPLAAIYRIGEGPWLRVHCSKGTYIRTLCHDIGEALGCGGHMMELRREASGTFPLSEAISLDEAVDMAERGVLAAKLLSPARALSHMTQIVLTDDEVKAIRQGKALYGRDAKPEDSLAAAVRADELIAVVKAGAQGEWRPIRVFNA